MRAISLCDHIFPVRFVVLWWAGPVTQIYCCTKYYSSGNFNARCTCARALLPTAAPNCSTLTRCCMMGHIQPGEHEDSHMLNVQPHVCDPTLCVNDVPIYLLSQDHNMSLVSGVINYQQRMSIAGWRSMACFLIHGPCHDFVKFGGVLYLNETFN